MKYTFTIRLGGGQEKLVVQANPGELAWHVVLKVLGYILFREHRPRIEEGIGWHYKPDLVALDAEGKLALWVDCGNIAVRKIDRVARKVGKAPFYILRRTEHEADTLVRAMTGKVRDLARVKVLSFDEGVVDEIAAWLDATNDLTCRRRDESLELTLENRRGRLARATKVRTWSDG